MLFMHRPPEDRAITAVHRRIPRCKIYIYIGTICYRFFNTPCSVVYAFQTPIWLFFVLSIGTAFAVLSHSPLKAFISQLLSSCILSAYIYRLDGKSYCRKQSYLHCGNIFRDHCLGRHVHHNSPLPPYLTCQVG